MMYHSQNRPPSNPANRPSPRFFAEIGITSSMRVLDVGCGNGDLSRFLAGLAGPDGEVVAIDRSEEALAMARVVESVQGAAPIRYCRAELTDALPDIGQFDAIVGRRVLMYLPDAAAALVRLAALAKPGAIVAFQEHARAGLPSASGEPALHRQLYGWMWDTVAAEGGDVTLGLRLVELMCATGLHVETAHCEAVLLQTGEPSFLPSLAQAMLPRMIERGITTAEEARLDTLDDCLEEEHRAVGGTIVWDLAFLVSARRLAR
jgi:SAM-dependent methyltransferase